MEGTGMTVYRLYRVYDINILLKLKIRPGILTYTCLYVSNGWLREFCRVKDLS
jgi:hypothetical protein